jgi:hypothetical protein
MPPLWLSPYEVHSSRSAKDDQTSCRATRAASISRRMIASYKEIVRLVAANAIWGARHPYPQHRERLTVNAPPPKNEIVK